MSAPVLWVRSLAFNIGFYGLLIAMMVFGAPTLILKRPAAMRLSRMWARASLWLLRVLCGTRVAFRGLENMPRGGCLVAAKHQSFLDIIALISLLPDFTFVLKRELSLIPLFGLYVARLEQVAIDREGGRAALSKVVAQARRAVADGRPLVIFPEGTRRAPGAAPLYKSGGAFVYAETGAPCIPVALNTGLFWPRRALSRRPGTAVVAFLPPIAPGLDRRRFQDRLEGAIEGETSRLLAEAAAIDPGIRVPAGVRAAEEA